MLEGAGIELGPLRQKALQLAQFFIAERARTESALSSQAREVLGCLSLTEAEAAALELARRRGAFLERGVPAEGLEKMDVGRPEGETIANQERHAA